MLTKEDYEALPEKARAGFALDEQSGEYVPVKDAKLKQTLDELDGKFKTAEQRSKDLEEKLNGFEQSKKDEIEQARAEALEKARTNGDVKAIEERYQQQLADSKKRSEETESQYKQRLEALEKQIKADKRNSIVADLSAELAHDKAHKAFRALVGSRIDVDPSTGQAIFLDENGSATSLDLAGFKAEIERDDAYAPLLKSGVVTSGGGQAKGSGSGGAVKKKFNEMNGAELAELRKSNPAEYQRLKTEYSNS